ncbi:hypothetical protein ACEWY4_019380 [Coilia grayii]|uniref:UPAR/Ly6 domain-containing protein n=1 Tax=Coilia grayii TaxID=363190 RepID=A0ABD1J9S6_9TELE
MSHLLCILPLLCLLPAVAPLFCYTCVFPAISPLHCIRYPQKCPPWHQCLTSRAVGQRGDTRIVLYEKSCIPSSLCGLSGEKFAMGLNFTFTNECCDTHLCNGATSTSRGRLWAGSLLCLLTVLLW